MKKKNVMILKTFDNDNIMKYILLLSLFIKINGYLLNHWYPVLPLDSYDFNNPTQVNLLNKKLVIWKKNDEIILQENFCLHRLAPLSEGYIDKETQNLRCSYHGWEFNDKGKIERIPQTSSHIHNNCRKKLKTYPTKIYGNLIWAYFGDDEETCFNEEVINKFKILPEQDFMVKDLPYDIELLLENFFDPAHIPFAHHKLQSIRDLASPVKIKSIYQNSSGLSFYFEDNTYLKKDNYRNGTMTFEVPCYYHLLSDYPKVDLKKLNIFCVPLSEGNTRVFLGYEFNEGLLKNVYPFIPKWFIHTIVQTFFDSDTMLLYGQEQYLRENNKGSLYDIEKHYTLPTSSDKSVLLFNKWKKKHFFYNNSVNFNNYNKISSTKTLDSIDVRKKVLDRYDQHIVHCKHCRDAYNNIKILINFFSFSFISLGLLDENTIYFGIGITLLIYKKNISNKFLFQDYRHREL